jgi:hypothetical protein
MTRACTWEDLDTELERWREGGAMATLWWRDDDAGPVTPALERLVALSSAWRVPLSAAVVPAALDEGLDTLLGRACRGAVLQHGWAHRDHAAADEPAAELGDHRPADRVLAELAEGRERLAQRLAERFVPVLVPPWNRIATALVPRLSSLGYRGLSRFDARRDGRVCEGLTQVNCHVDPVDWKRGALFRGEARCLDALCAHLRSRRTGSVDPEEPTGLLTHHLVHGPELWSFLERLFEAVAGRPCVRWLDAREVFAV